MTIVSDAIGAVKNWWWFIIKGVLFIIAGIAVLSRPLEGYIGLSLLFSLVILGTGFSQVFFAVSNSKTLGGWGWTLASGIIDIAIGAYLVASPAFTMATLPFFVGFWLMFRSFYIVGASFDLDDMKVPGWGWLLTGGILLLGLSILVLSYPLTGAIGIVSTSGAAFIAGGIVNFFLAFKFRDVKKTVQRLA